MAGRLQETGITSGSKKQRKKHREVSCAAEQTIQLAEQCVQRAGDADAQFSLGQYHYSGGDYETALRYFSSAEAGGSAQASYQLGVMFYDGLGASQNPVSSAWAAVTDACYYYWVLDSFMGVVLPFYNK